MSIILAVQTIAYSRTTFKSHKNQFKTARLETKPDLNNNK